MGLDGGERGRAEMCSSRRNLKHTNAARPLPPRTLEVDLCPSGIRLYHTAVKVDVLST